MKDHQNILYEIKKDLDRKLEILLKSMATAKEAKRTAPSAMESGSDTTKSEMGKLITALEINIGNIKKHMALIPSELPAQNNKLELWQAIKVGDMMIFIVPEGMGGEVIDGIRLVSENAPLVKKLQST